LEGEGQWAAIGPAQVIHRGAAFELAKVDERLREIERIEAKLLKNIPHTGFRAASKEARLLDEKEMLSDTARKIRNRIAVAMRAG
jgi:hypothetical protein